MQPPRPPLTADPKISSRWADPELLNQLLKLIQPADPDQGAVKAMRFIQDVLSEMDKHGITHPFPFGISAVELERRREIATQRGYKNILALVDLHFRLVAEGRGKLDSTDLELEIFRDILAQHGVMIKV